VQLSPEFQALWTTINPRTTYRVEFKTEDLIGRGVAAIRRMERIQPSKISSTVGAVSVSKAGVATQALTASQEAVEYHGPLPDLLAYLQNETELTRSTLVRILKESGRLAEFFINPQRFSDAIAAILKHELHALLIDGIKYERIPTTDLNAQWEMLLFQNEELINYLNALQVNKSVYEYIVYDSAVERAFARRLDEREDIRLFVKLPGWFKVDTPIGTYNPDWAILKHDDKTLYLVRETKGTKDFLKLRSSEADKVRCGQKHFEAIGVPFAVVVTADEV
jgi:type III restriction enzyme